MCPPGIIEAVTYVRTPSDVLSLMDMVEAIEVQTTGLKMPWLPVGISLFPQNIDVLRNLWCSKCGCNDRVDVVRERFLLVL